MAEEETVSIEKLLDDMALKIMMVEPGDLAVVGELVVLVESLDEILEVGDYPKLQKMAHSLREAFGKIVMTELADTPGNFDLLGKCIGLMQEMYRKKGDDQEGEQSSADLLQALQAGASSSEPRIQKISGGNPPTVEPKSDTSDIASSHDHNEAPSGPKIIAAPPESLDFMQDPELLTGFIEETTEHLDSIEVNILELEDNPGDLDIINNIFRPFHTSKGVSGFLNLTNIQALAHSTENLLDDVRNNKRTMDSEVIEVVLKVGDCLKLLVDNLKKALDEGIEKYKNYDISNYISWVKCVQGVEQA